MTTGKINQIARPLREAAALGGRRRGAGGAGRQAPPTAGTRPDRGGASRRDTRRTTATPTARTRDTGGHWTTAAPTFVRSSEQRRDGPGAARQPTDFAVNGKGRAGASEALARAQETTDRRPQHTREARWEHGDP